MSATLVGELADQAQKFWSPVMVKELKEDTMLPSLVNRDYQGEIRGQGDTVYVSQIKVPTGQIKTVGSGHEYFSADKLETARVAVVADKVLSASFELDSLIPLQTQLGNPNGESEIRDALTKSLELKLNDYIYSLVSPSTSAPDHVRNGITDYNASELLTDRKLASQAKWRKDGEWYGLFDASYWNDLLSATTLVSADYVDDRPVLGGQMGMRRFGFNMFEDNSDGILQLSPAGTGADCGLLFHRDFMLLAMQKSLEFKISDLHVNKQLGFLVSAHMVVGAKLGLEGSVKHIQVYNT